MAVETTAAHAATAGVTALTMTLIGVEPQALFWAFVGASIGLSWAAAVGRFRAAAVFLCVTLGAALIGTWASLEFFGGATPARNGLAFVLGVCAHPALSAVMEQMPGLFAGWADRLGARK